jgi:drug/metabolite transporter (DMT)-like permease
VTLILAFLSSVVWGTSDFMAGNMSRRFKPIAVLGGSQIFGGLLAVGFAIGTNHWDINNHSALIWGLSAGLLGLVGLIAFYSALSTGQMGIVSPISSIGVVIPLTIGLLHGDSPSVGQKIGIAIAILGVVLASGPELQSKASAKPVLLALVAAVTFGICVFCMAQGGKAGNPAMTIATMRIVQNAVLITVALSFRSIGGLRPVNIPLLAAIGFTDAGANLLFAFAAARSDGLLSIVSVLGSLFPVVTVILAWQILKERLLPAQYIGIVCTIIGVAAITAS